MILYRLVNRIMIICFVLMAFLLSCSENKLPILGKRNFENGDTIYTQIPDFSLIDQFGNLVSKNELKGKIHVADFFFTSCSTICPKTMRSMMRIAKHFENHPELNYLCFSIDFRKDSVARLKSYYEKLDIHYSNFHLLHIPSKEEIKRISEDYMSIAVEDPSAPGGFEHSGWLLLTDKNFHIRSYCLGTSDVEVDRFIEDIELLLHEK